LGATEDAGLELKIKIAGVVKTCTRDCGDLIGKDEVIMEDESKVMSRGCGPWKERMYHTTDSKLWVMQFVKLGFEIQ